MMKAKFLMLFILAGVNLISCIEKKAVTDPLLHVPDGYSVEVVAGPDLLDYPMFATLDETGRLFVFESVGNVYPKTDSALTNPQFRIKLLEDTNNDGVYDKSTIFADKVGFPQGGVFYKGSLYASSAPDLLKFTDTDGDGVADQREVILSGWKLNVNANSLVGPFMAPDGWLYLTSAIEGFDVTSKEGDRLKGETARIWRLRTDGTGLEWISAGGMNNPVGLAFTTEGEPIGTETYFTNPKAGERDALVYWIEGGVYPKPNTNIDRDKLVRTGDLMPVVSKYSRVAPSGITTYRSNIFGEGFENNLFSAQFNTHKIIRHKFFREGASFRTEDETFFWSDDEDFHPTDVLEDADGSLLVVETGGWFIKGCPLSQVSKPELKGTIYRIQRKGYKRPGDLYGNKIAWSNLQPDEAIDKMVEGNIVISDRATQRLTDLGNASIDPLRKILTPSSPVKGKLKSVFALYRIGTPEALAEVRNTLSDPDPQVCIAASRVAGMAKDAQAAASLRKLLNNDNLAVRRQAATALGQIGDKESAEALLLASEKTDDRFINHAIIYSLITLNDPGKIVASLKDTSARIKKVALIALDQMTPSPLQAKDVIDFLNDGHPSLKRTALWIASHHPEWSSEMIRFLADRFKQGSLSEDDEELLSNIIISFDHNPQMQQFVAQQITNTSLPLRLFLLKTIEKSKLDKFPGSWVSQLNMLLKKDNSLEVKSNSMRIIRLQGLTGFAHPLTLISNDAAYSDEFRVEAISTVLKSQPEFSDEQFNYLYQILLSDKGAALRQEVATTLSQGKLSEKQILRLSSGFLPKADAFILPRIIPVFKGAHSVAIGKSLISALMNSSSLSGFSQEYLENILEDYPDSVKPHTRELMTRLQEVRAKRLEQLEMLEKGIAKGSIDRGRALFFGKGTCFTCHTIGSQGSHFGPDLTSIQRDRSLHDLTEAIIYPGASFVREYETYKIKTTAGEEYTGIIKEKSPEAIIVAISPETNVRILRGNILSMDILDISMMPQGFDHLLSQEEIADLLKFLLAQDQDPETDQKLLR